jgi:crotonobetainyl-CoA:carnitine CoA-transferase CaiB-like acyl-CoA transferase
MFHDTATIVPVTGYRVGGRGAQLDLDDPADAARLRALLGAADVLIDGYTDGVLARFGLDELSLRAAYPDLVLARVSCYGHIGPLKGRKGFQQVCTI